VVATPASSHASAVLNGSRRGPAQHDRREDKPLSASSKDGGNKADGTTVKSEKELEKECNKAGKAVKFQARKKAQPQTAGHAGNKKREEKNNDEGVLPAYVEETAKGDKKMPKSLEGPYHKG
jgi:valyl-tRNA synthetase